MQCQDLIRGKAQEAICDTKFIVDLKERIISELGRLDKLFADYARLDALLGKAKTTEDAERIARRMRALMSRALRIDHQLARAQLELLPIPAQTEEPRGLGFEAGGITFDPSAIAALLYLQGKHPNSCVLTRLPQLVVDTRPQPSNVVNEEAFRVAFQRCIDQGADNVLFLIKFLFDGGAHANAAIYNTASGELEIFEPQEAEGGEGAYRAIEQLLANASGRTVETFMSSAFCPVGPQSDEERARRSQDPVGYCQGWSLWWLDMRMSNPEQRRDVLWRAIERELQSKDGTAIIRRYTSYLAQRREQLLKDVQAWLGEKPERWLVSACELNKNALPWWRDAVRDWSGQVTVQRQRELQRLEWKEQAQLALAMLENMDKRRAFAKTVSDALRLVARWDVWQRRVDNAEAKDKLGHLSAAGDAIFACAEALLLAYMEDTAKSS